MSYTTGVPPVVGAMMLFKGHWKGEGVFNVEQLPSKPFMDEIGKQGLPWHLKEMKPEGPDRAVRGQDLISRRRLQSVAAPSPHP